MPAAEISFEVDATAFDLGPRSDRAVLCLHGLTGTPYEVRPVAEALAGAGLRALGPVLPGHGRTPEELAERSHDEWLDAARADLRVLQRDHERVSVVGLSLGGLLTLALAAEERVDAVVAIGTPLRLSSVIRACVPLLKHVTPVVPKRRGSDIRDPAARERHPSLTGMPLHSVHELMRLQRRVRATLPSVRAPVFVAHGVHDRTADPKDMEEIVKRVSSPVRDSLLLPDSGHVVPVDHDGPRLAERVVQFLQRHG